jgi:hypothetical protein
MEAADNPISTLREESISLTDAIVYSYLTLQRT